ncbi:MAG: thioredoxin domain-containing protein [Planctomycetota bacterium]|nr:thioredoxin domain-containing protein [Planctomycetota bacterium]
MRWPLAILAVLTALVAASRPLWERWWPCPACQGGGHYQRLFGVEVQWYAVAALLGLALLTALRRPLSSAALAALSAGGALWFLWASWQLALLCPYCLTVHVGILACAALAGAASVRHWAPLALLVAIGFLGLHFAFHPTLRRDELAPLPTSAADTASPPAAAMAAIAARRTLGRPDAPQIIDIIVDPHCARCAALHHPLRQALAPAIADGRVQLRTRFLLRARVPSAAELARHALASADAREFALLLAVILGSPEERGWAALRARVAEVLDPAAIEARLAAEQPLIDAVLAEDQRWLAAQRLGRAPAVVLTDRDGRPRSRWEGPAVDPAAIAAAVQP